MLSYIFFLGGGGSRKKHYVTKRGWRGIKSSITSRYILIDRYVLIERPLTTLTQNQGKIFNFR